MKDDFSFQIGDTISITVYLEGYFAEPSVVKIVESAQFDFKMISSDTLPDSYTLNLEVYPPQAGNIQGAGEYQPGEQVSIIATANEGWQFVNWTGDTGYMDDPDAASTTVTMPAQNVSLTANFEMEDYDWFRDTETEVVEVTNPTTGKIWMDRNLVASRRAESSTDIQAYGDLYQWGRAADGHQKRDSNTTTAQSDSDTPGHGDFIFVSVSPLDWRKPQNNDLWQGVNGVNNPCPPDYRLPTSAELDDERESWDSNDPAGAFASPLKLPAGGFRHWNNGNLPVMGTAGRIWSSTVGGTGNTQAVFLDFRNVSPSNMTTFHRANGNSVRCFKDCAWRHSATALDSSSIHSKLICI